MTYFALNLPVRNFIGVHLLPYCVHIVVPYHPPSNTHLHDVDLKSFLESFAPCKELILVGDFNLPAINWSGDVPTSSTAQDTSFLDCFASLGLHQWVTEATNTRADNTLDLVFTTTRQGRSGAAPSSFAHSSMPFMGSLIPRLPGQLHYGTWAIIEP